MKKLDDIPCGWAPASDALYRGYHDHEWGVPERDSRALWEKFQLDGFQAGLSWITILRKREEMRRGVRRLRSREDRPLEQEAHRPRAEEPRHHPQPDQDRGHHQQRAALSRHG